MFYGLFLLLTLKDLYDKIDPPQLCPALTNSAGCPQPQRGSQLKQVFRPPEIKRADQVTSVHTSQPTSRGLASQKPSNFLCLSAKAFVSPKLAVPAPFPALPMYHWFQCSLWTHTYPSRGPHGGHRGSGFGAQALNGSPYHGRPALTLFLRCSDLITVLRPLCLCSWLLSLHRGWDCLLPSGPSLQVIVLVLDHRYDKGWVAWRLGCGLVCFLLLR